MTETVLQVAGEITKVETRRGQALRFIVDTQEAILPEVRAKLMVMVDTPGYFLFLPGEKKIEAWEIAGLPPLEVKEEKSPSVRLRNVLYRLWIQEGKPNLGAAVSEAMQFDGWYRDYIERAIEAIKAKLT